MIILNAIFFMETIKNIIKTYINSNTREMQEMSPSERLISDQSVELRYNGNIFNQYYHNIRYYIVPKQFHEDRTYEEPYFTYYIVCTPFNDSYSRNTSSYEDDIKNINNTFKRRYNYDRILITREIVDCEKIHYNVVFTTASRIDLTLSKPGTFIRGRYSAQSPRILVSIGDINRVIDYVLKESKRRPFYKDKDFLIYSKT